MSLPESFSIAALGATFIGGLATAFTPCVYPMIPITVGIMGAGKSSSWRSTLVISMSFVLGMALVYSALGFTAATTGRLLGSITQTPLFTGLVAALFFLMGLSMLGFFEIRLPSSLNQWLARKGGAGVGGSFTLGMVTGSLAAPCSGPVVISILAIVAQKSNPFWGFTLLFFFSLGLGAPFFVLGTFSNAIQRIPRGGAWTNSVKHVFGMLLIFTAFYLISPFVSRTILFFLGGMTTVALSIFLPRMFPVQVKFALRIRHALQISLFVGAAALLATSWASSPGQATSDAQNSKVITWLTSEQEGKQKASSLKLPTVIDFYAEWCAACKELDEITFADHRVRERIREDFVAVRVDATAMDAAVQKTLQKYGILALPTVLFVDPQGKVMTDLSVTSFVPANDLLPILEKATSRGKKS